MKKINAREHTEKYIKLSKNAAMGTFPNKKVAKTASKIGLGVGATLIGAGIYGLTKNVAFGVASIVAGTTTLVSNNYNLKRINKKK